MARKMNLESVSEYYHQNELPVWPSRLTLRGLKQFIAEESKQHKKEKEEAANLRARLADFFYENSEPIK